MSQELFVQAWRTGSRSKLARAVVVTMLFCLCAGGVALLAFTTSAGWMKTGEMLLQAGLVGSVIVVLVWVIAVAEDPKIVATMRSRLFDRIDAAVKALHGRLTLPPAEGQRLFDYSAIEHRWNRLPVAEKEARVSPWKPYRDERTYAMHCHTLRPGPEAPAAIVIISLWVYGRKAHLGIFVHRRLYDAALGSGACDRLIKAAPDYFLCPNKDLIQRDRGEYALVDHLMQSDQLLTDPYLHDAIETGFTHLMEHVIVVIEGELAGLEAAKPAAGVRGATTPGS